MKIAVCEDNRAIREELSRLIQKQVSEVDIAEYPSGEELLNANCKTKVKQTRIIRCAKMFCMVFALMLFFHVTAYAQQENSIVTAEGANVPQDTQLPAEYRFPEKYQEYAVQFLTEDGVSLCGYVLGNGKKGVTLAHANGWMVKSWLPFAEKLVEQGYQVILWEFRNNAPSGSAAGDMAERWDLDVQAAAQVLRERGVKEMICMGCSYGGTATAAAAPSISELKGLAILSSPCYNQQINPMDALSKITVPVFFAVSTEDGQGAPGVYQREVEALYEACASSEKEIHIVEGPDHGTDMITIPEEGTLGYATVPDTEEQRENRKRLEDQLLEFTNAIFEETSGNTSPQSTDFEETSGNTSPQSIENENIQESVPNQITMAAAAIMLILAICGIIFLFVRHSRHL